MATRFYLPSTIQATVTPAYSSEWEDTSAMTAARRRRMSTGRFGSAMTDVATTTSFNNAPNSDKLALQYVSDPLSADTTISGTLKGQIKALTSSGSRHRTQIVARVVSNDGSTVRGVLYAGDLRTGNLIPNPSFETDTSGWISNNSTFLTIARSTAWAASGAGSASLAASVKDPAFTGSLQTWQYVVPVTAGSTYTATCAVRAATNTRRVRLVSQFAPAAGAFTRLDYGPWTATSTSADTVLSLTSAAPAGSAYMNVEIQVEYNPKRTNLIPNPSFEVNTTGWVTSWPSDTTIARSTAWSAVGTASILVTATTSLNGAAGTFGLNGNTALGSVIAGSSYTLQCTAKMAPGGRTSGTAFMQLYFYNSAGAQVGSTIASTNFSITNAANTVMSVTTTAPATAVQASLAVRMLNPVAADAMYFDAFLLEQSATVDAYFDGTYPGHRWTGTAHASPSQTPGKRVNLVPNPSFTTDITGWVNGPAGQTLARSTAWSSTGTGSILVSYGTSVAGSMQFDSWTPNTISVTAGQVYTVSCKARAVGNSRQARLSIYWCNASSTAISSTIGTYTTISTSADGSLSVTGVAPAGAVYCYIDVLVNSTTTGDGMYFDAFLMEASPVVGLFFDGSFGANYSWTGTANNSASTTTGAARVNLITNPSFEVDTAGWSAGLNMTMSRTTGWGQTGTAAMVMTPTATSPAYMIAYSPTTVVVPGKTLTASAYFKAAPGAASCLAYVHIQWLDAASVAISQSSNAAGVATSTSASVRVSHTATAPANAAYARIWTDVDQLTSTADVHYIDAVLLEESGSVGTYFDGTSGAGYGWVGTANASASEYYDTYYFDNFFLDLGSGPADADELTTSARNQQIPANGAGATVGLVTVSNVSALTGDRIVFEIGVRDPRNVPSASTGTTTFTAGDDAATDYATAGVETTALNPWIELSTTIPFALPPVNNLFAYATPIDIPTNGATYTSPAITNVGYTLESGETGSYYRSAWWKYLPRDTGSATFDTSLTTGAGTDTYMRLYSGTAIDALTLVAQDDDSGDGATSSITTTVTDSVTYYIQVLAYYDYDLQYVLRATGPTTANLQLVPPPADTEVSGVIPILTILPPPAETEVSAVPAPLAYFIALPSAEVGVSAVAGIKSVRIRNKPRSPLDDAVVPVLRPTFSVDTYVVEGTPPTSLEIEVQYSEWSDFSSAVTTLSREAVATKGTDHTEMTATSDLPTGVYIYWRSRIIADGVAHAWSASSQRFIVDPTVGDHEIPLVWDVTSDTPWPHLWSVDPLVGTVGTEVTIVGQGLPLSGGAVTLAGVEMSIQSRNQIAATTDAATDDRQIADVVDAEHDVIIALVPDGIPSPGGPLLVEGN